MLCNFLSPEHFRPTPWQKEALIYAPHDVLYATGRDRAFVRFDRRVQNVYDIAVPYDSRRFKHSSTAVRNG